MLNDQWPADSLTGKEFQSPNGAIIIYPYLNIKQVYSFKKGIVEANDIMNVNRKSINVLSKHHSNRLIITALRPSGIAWIQDVNLVTNITNL